LRKGRGRERDRKDHHLKEVCRNKAGEASDFVFTDRHAWANESNLHQRNGLKEFLRSGL